MALPRAVLRWPFLLRAFQILCCIICLGAAGYIANADDAFLWGNGRNVTYLALFVALYGMLVSSLMIASILSKGTISRVLPGLIDVINSGLATLFFIIIGAAAINVKPPWCNTAYEFTWTSITNSTDITNNSYNSSLPGSSSNATHPSINATSSSSSDIGQPLCSAWDTVLVMGFFNGLLYAICTVYAGLDMKRGKGLISVTDDGKVGPGSYHVSAAAVLGVGRWTPAGTAMPLEAGATGTAAAAAAGSTGDGSRGGSSGGGVTVRDRDSNPGSQPYQWPDNAAAAAAASSAAAAAAADPFLWATSSSGGSRPATSATGRSSWNVQSPSSRLVVHDFSDYPAQPQAAAAAAASAAAGSGGSSSWGSRLHAAVTAAPAAAAAAAMAPLTAAAAKLPVRSRNQQTLAGVSSSGDWAKQLLSSSPGAAAAATPTAAAGGQWQQQQQLRHGHSSSSGVGADTAALAAVAAASDRSEALIGTSMHDYWQYWYGDAAQQQQQQQQGTLNSSQQQQQQQGTLNSSQQQPSVSGGHPTANGSTGNTWQQQQQQQQQQQANGIGHEPQHQQQQQQRPLMTIEQFEAMQL